MNPQDVLAVALERATFGAPGADGAMSDSQRADVQAILGLLYQSDEEPLWQKAVASSAGQRSPDEERQRQLLLAGSRPHLVQQDLARQHLGGR